MARKYERSPLQRTEQMALVLDRQAIIRLVSSVRRYRSACSKLLKGRWGSGECDVESLTAFFTEIDEIEEEG